MDAVDKEGNDAADELAREGAASHQLPPQLVQDVQHRKIAAKRVQRMMIDILAARRACEAEQDAIEQEHEMAELDASFQNHEFSDELCAPGGADPG